MKIAQVAPLHESVPPKSYGGTERIVSYFTEELVRQGHDVTLFASGDSVTSADLVPIVEHSLRLDPDCRDPLLHHIRLIDQVVRRAPEFDILHFHTDYLHFPLMRRHPTPHVTTLHGRLDLPELRLLFHQFPDMPAISISHAQREPLPHANWQGTVYHGLPPELYTFHPEPAQYLAFLGRIAPEKRVDRAIQIAIRAGMELRIAAKVDRTDVQYFEEQIRPMLDHPLIHYVGEISEQEKCDFLGNARALLFPVDWPEPFGLVMAEAMACGTPVIGYRRGSVPEVIDHGASGFVVDDEAGALDALAQLDRISRQRCRRLFEERFSVARMADDYVALYKEVIAQHAPGRLAS